MNPLLLWMSARQAGSASSFRARVAELQPEHARRGGGAAPHYLAAWMLSKLGHAEFHPAADGAGWRVAPPVLAASGIHASPHAVLCGARTEPLLAALAAAADAQRLHLLPQPGAPDLVEVHAESSALLSRIGADARIPIQWNAPLAILAACPPVSEIALQQQPMPIGAGWTVSRFSKSGLAWVPCTPAEIRSPRTNLFRFKGEYSTTYMLQADGRSWICDAAIGKYRVLTRRHRPLTYSAPTQDLAIALSCRPPELVERALVISSGRLPEVRGTDIVYTRIAPATAATAAAVLGQRFY